MGVLDFLTSIQLWQAIILVAGLLLVVVEMFHPGFGAPGIMGAVLIVLAVVLIANTFLEALILIIIVLAVLGVALSLVLQSATKGRLAKTLILNDSLKKESGFIGTEDLEYFLGKEGVTQSVLRPAGTADFDGVKLDVVSEGGFIPKDSTVRIIKVEGRRIVVRQC